MLTQLRSDGGNHSELTVAPSTIHSNFFENQKNILTDGTGVHASRVQKDYNHLFCCSTKENLSERSQVVSPALNLGEFDWQGEEEGGKYLMTNACKEQSLT